MTIVSCPKCDEQVMMPSSASPQATVRCPLCCERFVLGEIVDTLPPTLEVLEDPNATAKSGNGGLGFAAAPGTPAGPAFSLDSPSSADTSAPAGAKRRKVVARPARKQKSGAMEAVKIVLGGVAGLTIAQLLLWWMPWDNWRRDPFKLGPTISQYAPWLVPAKFHGPGAAKPAQPEGGGPSDGENLSESGLPQRTFEAPDANDGGSAKKNNANKQNKKSPRSNSSDQASGGFPAPDPDALTAVLPDDGGAGVSLGLGGGGLLELDPALNDTTDLETDPGLGLGLDLDEAAAADAESDPLMQPAPEPEITHVSALPVEQPAPQRLPKAAKISAGELKAALGETQTAINAVKAAEAENVAAAWRRSYKKLAKLAEAVALAADVDQNDLKESKGLLRSLGKDSEAVQALGGISEAWIKGGPQRGTNGVVLVGTIVDVSGEGELSRVLVQPPADQATVVVYVAGDPSSEYQESDQVLFAGAIVDNPAENLAGYDGGDEQVIWGSVAQKLSN